jgi:hypothetical protein
MLFAVIYLLMLGAECGFAAGWAITNSGTLCLLMWLCVALGSAAITAHRYAK